MKKSFVKPGVLFVLSLLAGLNLSPCLAGMTVQSLTGPVTATEISSFESFMAGQSPLTTNTYDNNLADGTAGMDCEALGLMYEVTNDPALLNQMIQFADAFLSLRNDFTDRRVMWTGNVEPVWLTKPTGTSAGYAGCENNDIVGHIAYCAKLILQTPSLWNTPVPIGDPHGYGTTYLQRAQTYITQMEYSEDSYFNPWFIDTNTDRIKDSTAVDPRFSAFGQSTTAWNRQMMFINGWQRLSECHALLGDNPGKVAFYDAIVQASVSWFQSEWQNTNGGGQSCYVWQYAPGHSGGNEEMNGHAAYDMWGLSRVWSAGKYGMTQPLLRPFAETLRYIIYQAGTSYTFAEWVNGDTSKTRNYIYSQWMGISAYDPCVFDIMANADISQGSQGSTPIYDAMILWVKNSRYLGIYPNSCDAADFSLSTPWVENLASGGTTNYPVTVNSLYGFGAGGVTLSMSGQPAGVTASFSPGASSTLTLSASGSVSSGVYAATIMGTGSGIARTVPVTLVITNAGVPGFTISATPSSQNTTIGSGTSYAVTVGSVNGFNGTVNLSASGFPANSSGSFSPASISGGSGSSTLNISTATNTPSGNDTLTITGVSGTLTNSTTVSLVLNDFSISATPSSQTVTAGAGTNYTVTVGNVNGFGGTVTFSASGLPSGASASFNPASVTSIGSSTMTVTTSGATPAGTNALTITGTSGSLMHSAGVSLVVNAGTGGGTWTTNNDTDSAVAYSAGWSYSANRNDGDYLNDVHYTKTNGNYAQFTFNGTGIEYLTETYSDEGNVDVYLDGVLQTTVNCNSSTRQSQVVAYVNTSLSTGSHTIKIVKSSGTYMLLDAFASISTPVPDFAINTTPGSQTVTAGNGTAYTATVSATNGFNGNVSFSVSGLPTGASGSFSPASVSGSGSSTLNVATSTATAPGTYSLIVTGTSGSLTHSNTVTLVVNPAPDFSISASPSSESVNPGDNTTYTATISALNGFNGNVALTVGGLPTGANGSFSPNSVTGSGSSTLSVTTSTSTAPGTYTLTVTGTSGSLVHNSTVTLVVNTPDFSISTGPASRTLTAGNSTNYMATVSAINGFSGNVNFSVTGLPPGASGSFSPASVTGSGSSTLTITTTNTLPASTNTLTVTGTSGSLVHSNTVTLVINPAQTGALPDGWTDSDIGAVGVAGIAAYTNGVFTIQGSGADIYGTSDEFNYCRETVTNDFTLTARVASLNSANGWSKSGVMIRGSASTNSAYVGLYLTTSHGIDMQCRTVNSSNAVDMVRVSGITAPYWVRLVRSGSTFTGYSSADGSTWTQVGSTNVSMAASVRAGLPVCSHDNTQLNTSTFDNVTAQ